MSLIDKYLNVTYPKWISNTCTRLHNEPPSTGLHLENMNTNYDDCYSKIVFIHLQ